MIQQSPLGGSVNDWQTFLDKETDAKSGKAIKQAERTDRPLGDACFVDKLEMLLARDLKRQKPGPKPKSN